MNLRERLIELKDKVYSITIGDDKFYYKHFKSSFRPLIKTATDDVKADCLIFALCVCDEKGEQLFSVDEVELISDIPRHIVTSLVVAAISGDEKKQQGD
ncbi:conserved hypothetical protein [Vibrio chagasii]|nr:conserved hypothetical protein [Vibrio chagasii]